MSVFKDPRREPFWRWFTGYTMRDHWWSIGLGVTQTIPAGMSFYISLGRWHGRINCVWDQWRDE